MSEFRVEADGPNKSWHVQSKHPTADEAWEAGDKVAATGREIRVTDDRGAHVTRTAAPAPVKPTAPLAGKPALPAIHKKVDE